MFDKSRLPSPAEVAGPIGKLLDFLKTYDGDWNEVPQVAALEQVFRERGRGASELVHCLRTATDEDSFGPMPRDDCKPHPYEARWSRVIDTLKNLAQKNVGETADDEYRRARKALLADPEVAARAPASIKTAKTLFAWRENIDEAARDGINIDEARRWFLADEFRPLRSWIEGRPLLGSPEWIPRELWFVQTSLELIYVNMHRVAQIRDAVKGEGVTCVRESRWKRFLEREFAGDEMVIRALEIAWNAFEIMAASEEQRR